MSEWARIKLADVATEVTVGHVGSMAKEYRHSGVPLLRSQNIVPHGFNLEDVKYVGHDFHNRLKKSALHAGDVVTVRTGKPGATAVVPTDWAEANCSDLVITRPGPGLDPYWLSYYINSAAAGYIDSQLVGAVQQHFNVGAAKAMVLNLPPLWEQRAIAGVLGALDDKIALNAKLASTAQALAGAIYDQLTTGVQSRRMSDVLEPVLGGTPKRSRADFWDGNQLWASAKDITGAPFGVISDTEERITSLATCETKAKPLMMGSVILTARGTVGSVARLARASSFNQSCYGFEPGNLPPGVLYHSILRATERAKTIAHGSVFDTITKSTFDHLTVPDMDGTLLHELESRIGPLLETVDMIVQQNISLAATRDILLPPLMSGKLRVLEAEALIAVEV